MIAFASEGFDRIAAAMTAKLAASGVSSRAMQVEVDNSGRSIEQD
jgi:hypothetical protein